MAGLNGARFRGAVARGSFEEAQEALCGLVRELSARLKTIPGGDAAAIATLRESAELLDWARRLTCAERARVAAELTRLTTALPYRNVSTGPAGSWRLDA